MVLTWYFLVARSLGNLGLVGISGVLGRWWWTAVSRDEVEDGSELVDNAVTLRKRFSILQRDPSTWRRALSVRITIYTVWLCSPWYFP